MRSKNLTGLALLLFVLFNVIACQKVYQIRIYGDLSAPIFETEQALYFRPSSSICVSEFDPKANKTTQIWLIERTQGAKDLFLSKVRYGELPDGFVTLTETKPLAQETIYVVYFRASGGVRALGYFKSMRAGDATVLVNVDSHGNTIK